MRPHPNVRARRGERWWRALDSLARARRTFLLVVAGGCAGAVARTATAPLDRIKLLLQVQVVGYSLRRALQLSSTRVAAGTGADLVIYDREYSGCSLLSCDIFHACGETFASDQHIAGVGEASVRRYVGCCLSRGKAQAVWGRFIGSCQDSQASAGG